MKKASRVRDVLRKIKADAALVTDSHAVSFFTGFRSSNVLWLVTGKRELLFTDGRYLSAAKQYFADKQTDVELVPATAADWQALFASLGVRSLGVNFERLTVSRFNQYKRDFGMELKDFSAQENNLRMRKTTVEIEGIHKACELADEALRQSLPKLRIGISEAGFAWQLEKTGRELGAEAVSFEPIVAFGDNSAMPHHQAGARKLGENMPILIDWGFLVNGFASDCTRCFYFGEPDKEWKMAYEQVLKAQSDGILEMRAGISVAAPQVAAEKVLGAKMPHGFGHGIGVEVHEHPHASPRGSGVFVDGSTVTAEPGLYLDGKFGIRIEDVVAISADEPRLLTAFPKELNVSILKS